MSLLSRQIGATIRALRKRRGLTGEELAQKAGISQSKISKIETGYYATPRFSEIKHILNILEAPSNISQQITRSLGDGEGHSDKLNFGTTFSPDSLSQERHSKRVRIYGANAIPALLQTADYRKAYIAANGLEEMLASVLKHTAVRQDMMWDGKRKYHIIMPHTALYTTVASRRIHIAQLDRIERMVTMSNVRIGIIPVEAGLLALEHSSFAMYDERSLVNALAQGEITSTDKEHIQLHLAAFHNLEGLASYDDEAIQLIRRAMDVFGQ